jgi:hypothetical protein
VATYCKRHCSQPLQVVVQDGQGGCVAAVQEQQRQQQQQQQAGA